MSARFDDRLRDESGVSLIELMMGIMILAVSLLGLAAAGGAAAQQVYLGRLDMSQWAVAQQQVETLRHLPYDSVKTDSATVSGYDVHWEVITNDPKKIVFVMDRTNNQGKAVSDTLILYIAKPLEE